MSDDTKNCRPLRTEWVPSAYRDDKGAHQPSIAPIKRDNNGFAKKALKIVFGKKRWALP